MTIEVYKILKNAVHIHINGCPHLCTKDDLEDLKKAIPIAEELFHKDELREKRIEWERNEQLYWKSWREKYRELSLPLKKLKDDITEKLRQGKLRGEKIQEEHLLEEALAKKTKWLETQTIESLVIIHEIARARLHELTAKLDKKYDLIDKSKRFGRFANVPEHPLLKRYLRVTQQSERYRGSKLRDLVYREVDSAVESSRVQGVQEK